MIRNFTLLLFIVVSQVLQAQCPVTLTLGIQSQTNPTCPSNGTVVLTSNASAVIGVKYYIHTGPAGVSTAEQSSNTFTSLPPGGYTFAVKCGTSITTTQVTLTTTYTQISATTTISNVCASYQQGGTIAVNATGGSNPLTYSFRLDNNANYSDALSTYGASSTFNATSYGTWQVRIKDNCGNFITKSVIIQPSLPNVGISGGWEEFNQPCNSGNIAFHFYLGDDDRGYYLSDFPNGLRVEVYEKGTNCNAGAFLLSQTFAATDEQVIVVPKRDLVFRVVTPCNQSRDFCYDFPDNPAFITSWNALQIGCASAANPNGLLELRVGYNAYATWPIFYEIRNSANILVAGPTETDNFPNMPFGTYYIKATDACGYIDYDTVVPPAIGSAVAATADASVGCASANGFTTVSVRFNGYMPNLNNATVTITAGPNNIGVAGQYDPWGGTYTWYNMVPGGTYTVLINTGCGTRNVNFTVPTDSWAILNQSLSVTVTQACNNGGVINASMTYNGWAGVLYKLEKPNNTSVYNTSGTFLGLAPGNYTVKGVINQDWCSNVQQYTLQQNVTILPDGNPPVVNRLFGFYCEDAGGAPLNNGKIIFRALGFGPFKVEYRKVSQTDAQYITFSASSAGTETISGLIPYENYRLRFTDQCGNTTLTDVTIGKLQEFFVDNTLQPCAGNAYTLSAPNLLNATYTWKKNNVVISTQREIQFIPFLASDDGTYICEMNIAGGCVQRNITVVLNSAFCDQLLLPVKLLSFNALQNKCTAQLNWITGSEETLKKFIVEHSTDGRQFTAIGETMPNGGKDITTGYQFVHHAPISGINYYRLKMVDINGKITYSTIAPLRVHCEAGNGMFTLFPNPVKTGGHITIQTTAKEKYTGELHITDATGRTVKKQVLNIPAGASFIPVATGNISKGLYFIKIAGNNRQEIFTTKITIL
jgi:Secretion system C-terminal sorting domain